MSLITRCPKCHSGFEVTSDQLRRLDGLVRCGHCSHVFDGFACLQTDLPTLTRKVQAPDASSAPVSTTDGLSQQGPVDEMATVPATMAAPQVEPSEQVVSTAPLVRDEPHLSAVKPVSIRVSSPTAHQFVADKSVYPRVVAQESASSDMSSVRRTDDARLPLSRPAARPSLMAESRFDASGSGSIRPEREPVLSVGRGDESDEDDPELESGPIRVLGEARLRGEDPSSAGRREPEFLDDPEPSAASRVLWFAMALLLVLTLVLQLLVYFRNDIATTMPMVRGMLVQICKPLGCEVNYLRQIDRIVIIGSSLRQVDQSEPPQQRSYTLRLTLQNRSDNPQQWPSLLLALTDASGTVIARRVVAPETYLPVSLRSGPFGARQEVALELPLSVNGLAVSGFELQRFFP